MMAVVSGLNKRLNSAINRDDLFNQDDLINCDDCLFPRPVRLVIERETVFCGRRGNFGPDVALSNDGRWLLTAVTAWARLTVIDFSSKTRSVLPLGPSDNFYPRDGASVYNRQYSLNGEECDRHDYFSGRRDEWSDEDIPDRDQPTGQLTPPTDWVYEPWEQPYEPFVADEEQPYEPFVADEEQPYEQFPSPHYEQFPSPRGDEHFIFGREEREETPFEEYVLSIAFSSDSTHMVSGQLERITVFRLGLDKSTDEWAVIKVVVPYDYLSSVVFVPFSNSECYALIETDDHEYSLDDQVVAKKMAIWTGKIDKVKWKKINIKDPRQRKQDILCALPGLSQGPFVKLRTASGKKEVKQLAVSHTCKYIAKVTSRNQFEVSVYVLTSLNLTYDYVKAIQVGDDETGTVETLCFDPTETYLCIGVGSTVVVYDLQLHTEVLRKDLSILYKSRKWLVRGDMKWCNHRLALTLVSYDYAPSIEFLVAVLDFRPANEFVEFVNKTLSFPLNGRDMPENVLASIVKVKCNEFGYSEEDWPNILQYIHQRYTSVRPLQSAH